MKVEILARTYENGAKGEDSFDKFQFILGGRAGGTCYAKEGYFDSSIYNEDKAIRIAEKTSSSGHHSVFEHSHVTLAITDIPKILAMVLNSTNSYVTSEKSARYTIMKPKTKLEEQSYQRWTNIFKDLIVKNYPDKDLAVDKLAMENARYMIDVFTPTSMCYTVSYRQLCYLVTWLDDLCEKVKLNDNISSLYKRLGDSAKELSDILKEKFIRNNYFIPSIKQKSFRFLATLNGKDVNDIQEVLGETYRIKYQASLACLAQLQRHRTLRYEMLFSDESNWYIPELIKGTNFEELWVQDLESLFKIGVYPQALKVNIVETGLVEDFLMKAHERLCARAQLEIMKNTMNTMVMLKEASKSGLLEKTTSREIEKWVELNEVKLKCKVCKCLEPCVWGPKGKLRKI